MILRNGTRDSIKQSGARVPYRAQEIRKAAREEVEGEAAGRSGGGAGARLGFRPGSGPEGLGFLQPFPHPTPPKHIIYYILLPPSKRFLPL